uniref:RING-type domain-containing protein n=1 Tax=Kalanchoe fedtschenkoi TaxID=63787 RepID=A0A7N0TR92_KALFE
MGGSGSKEESYSPSQPYSSQTSSSWDQYGGGYSDPQPRQAQSNYPPYYQAPPPQYYPQQPVPQYAPSQSFSSAVPPSNNKKLDRRYSRIADSYSSLEQVTEALARAGLESSNLIVGIDFTKSNEWTGKESFNGRSLHHISSRLNPYEQAISIIGKTLAAFDEDNLIPCFGFGDASTHDQDVFSFYPDDKCCHGFEEVLSRYREIAPHIRLSGPTSFAPVIEMATSIVEQSGGQYHVLLIIADGQVTRSVDTDPGHLSPQEQRTVDAIVQASKFPLSIILVGVGDGPWDMMREFDDNIPARDFDNFQFVNFTQIMAKNVPQTRKETEFALSALMEIPSQYKATIELNLLGGRRGESSRRVALPPPAYVPDAYSSPKPSMSFKNAAPAYYEPSHNFASTAPSAPSAPAYENVCPICLTEPKNMAFGCGHQTCTECGPSLQTCPICRSPIETRIKLY